VSSIVDGVGPFSRLGDLQPGDVVSVTLSDGTEEFFAVVKRERISKRVVDYDAIMRDSEGMLVLVTCGGSWNPTIQHYDDNVVVWAATTQVP
jgi:sortase (surface protein transpeptidase)